MGKHEKHLLMLITALLLAGITWVMIAAFVTRQSPILLIRNFFHSLLWVGLFLFFVIGLIGFYYEMTIISTGIQLYEADNEPYPISDAHAVDISIGLYITFVLGGLIFGIDEVGILEGLRNILLACLGFSIIIGLMLLGAIVARIRRDYF